MKEFLEKISSYNIFNNLLPGILFVLIAKMITTYDFIQTNVFLGLFFYYFVGLIISRVGSLIIEKFLKFIRFIKYMEHKDFINAQKQDKKIDILLENSNMYRTFCSMMFLLLILKIFEYFSIIFSISNNVIQILFIVLLLVLFLFSLRKQTIYIIKRIEHFLEENK